MTSRPEMIRNLTFVLAFTCLALLVSLKDKLQLLETYLCPRQLTYNCIYRHDQADKAMSDTNTGTTAQWLQNKFTTLYESASPDQVSDFKTHLASVFHKDVEIYHNHQQMSLGTFQDDLSQANAAHARSSIEWKEIFEASPSEGGDSESSIVAGSFIVTRSMKFRIRAGPAQRLKHNIFSAKIQLDKTAQSSEDGGNFLITQLFITSVEKAAPIHLPGMMKTDPET